MSDWFGASCINAENAEARSTRREKRMVLCHLQDPWLWHGQLKKTLRPLRLCVFRVETPELKT